MFSKIFIKNFLKVAIIYEMNLPGLEPGYRKSRHVPSDRFIDALNVVKGEYGIAVWIDLPGFEPGRRTASDVLRKADLPLLIIQMKGLDRYNSQHKIGC